MAGRTVTVTLAAAVGNFVSGMNTAAAAAGKLTDKLAEGGKTRQSWDQVGSTLMGVGAAALAGVGVAVKTFADFDKAMSAVAATGDDARSNLEGLREVAIQVGADTAFSAREAAGGMEELLKAGVSAQDVMGGGLKGALDLAAAGALEVGAAAEIAATAMTQFGLSGEDVPHIADLIAAGAGKAQGSVHEMGMALKQSGLVASQFGLSIEDTVGTLSAFASAGLIGSDAGTSFKTMLLSLANPSKESAKLMTELGIAAYDANGNFVGMANLAEQLQTRLGGLTQAQRDQALAQIFGNDAVRAANVLYNEGAAGIQEWVANVNDMGYAAETAATMQDNLAGDIEKLTGSLESMFLKAGEGGNDFLRGVVQGAERAVDALGSLPAPVQQGALALTAIAGAGALVAGGLMKGVATVADSVSAFSDLAATAPRAAAGLRAVATAGLGLAAIGGTLAIFAAINQEMTHTAVSASDLANALVAMNNTAGQAGGGIEKMNAQFREINIGKHAQVLDGVGDAMRRVADPGMANGINRFFHELGLGTDATIEAQNAIAGLDQSLARMKPEDAAAAFRQLATEANSMGVSMDAQLGMFDAYRTSVLDAANALGVSLTPLEQYQAMMGNIPPRLQAAMDAANASKGALDGQAGALGEVAGAAQQAAGALMEYASAALGLSGSQLAVNSAILDAKDALEQNGKTLDTNTRAGIANQQALNGIAEKAMAVAEAQVKAGESGQVVGESMARNRAEFIKAAEAFGMSSQAANEMADEYGLIPGQIQGLAGAAATAGAAAGTLAEQLASIPATTEIGISVDGAEAVHGSVADIKTQLEGVPDNKQVVITMPDGRIVADTAGNIRTALEQIPPNTTAGITAPGAAEAQNMVRELVWRLEDLPEYKSIQVVMPDGSSTYTTAQNLGRAIRDIPDDKEVTLALSNGEAVTVTAGQVRDALGQINDRNVSIGADPSGAVAGAGTAQGALDATHGVTRDVNADPSGAISGSARAQGAIDSTHGVTRDIFVTSNAAAAASAAQARMDAVRNVSRTIMITTIQRTVGVTSRDSFGGITRADGGLIPAYAGPVPAGWMGAQQLAVGGMVHGRSPHPRADNVPIWATAGEVMMSNAAGNLYGRDRLLALNSRRVDPYAFAAFMRAQGLADGGQVRPQPVTQTAGYGPSKEYHFHSYNPVVMTESESIRKQAALAALGG